MKKSTPYTTLKGEQSTVPISARVCLAGAPGLACLWVAPPECWQRDSAAAKHAPHKRRHRVTPELHYWIIDTANRAGARALAPGARIMAVPGSGRPPLTGSGGYGQRDRLSSKTAASPPGST
jgi:hypothetical protein